MHDYSSGLTRLLGPLIMPLLVFIGSVLYVFARQFCVVTQPTDPADCTRPLIHVDDEGDQQEASGGHSTYLPFTAEKEEDAEFVEGDVFEEGVPGTTYGAI